MNTRLKIGLKILLVSLAAVAAYLIWPKEPRYQGHSVSYWLKKLDSTKPHYIQVKSRTIIPDYSGEAATAIRQIGAKALPYIITDLQAHDPKWKVKLMGYSKKFSWMRLPLTSDLMRRERGIKACQVLGPVARPAIPALGQALSYGSGSAVHILESFGPEAVPALAQALTNAPGCGNPYSTAIALGQMGAKARAAIPSLIWTYENHKISFPRAAAASASALICKELIEKANEPGCQEVRMTKAAFIRGLSDSRLVNVALNGLTQLGTNVPETAPLIARLLQDSDLRTRTLATNALHSVAPHFDLAALNKLSASN